MPINVKEKGAKGNGVTDDTAAIASAIGAAASGETVFFPTGTYLIDCEEPLELKNDVQIVGEGIDAVTLACSNSGSTKQLGMFVPGEGTEVSFSDLTAKGPTSIGTGGSFDAVYISAGEGAARAYRCRFDGFTSALRASSGVNWQGVVEASECRFIGYGSTGTKGSTPILLNHQEKGSRGRRVRVSDCDFEGFGDSATSLDHAIYVSTDWDVEVTECRFLTSVGTGYAIQFEDPEVTEENRGAFQVIRNCHFGSALSVRGITASRVSAPLIEGCGFENKTTAIVCNGGTPTVRGNTFLGAVGKEVAVIETHSPPTLNLPIAIEGNDFLGRAEEGLIAFIGHDGDYVFEANRFASPQCGAYIYIAGESPVVRLLANDFRGEASGALIALAASASLHVLGNAFLSTGGNCISLESEAATAIIAGNDFSQSSGTSVVRSKSPAAYRCIDNTGSNVGIASVASASTVTLPEVGVVFSVTGSTQIENITASFPGRIVTLKLIEAVKVATGGNLRLSGTIEFKGNYTLSLVCDGTDWYETAASLSV